MLMEFKNISRNIRNVIRKRFVRVPEYTRRRSRGIREIRKRNGTISVIDTLRVHEKLEEHRRLLRPNFSTSSSSSSFSKNLLPSD